MTKKNPKTEINLPEMSALIVKQILEKYNLKNIQKQGIKRFLDPNILASQKSALLNALPGVKISRLIRKYAKEEISLDVLPLLLEKELNISTETAKQIAEDLKKNLLIFIKSTKEEVPSKKLAKIKSTLPRPERPKSPPTKDRYRESV